MLMGVPSVWPLNVPERICTVSLSLRGVTILDWPGRRRSRSGWMSASESFRRGGQPSTTTPTPPPCDSPQVVMRKRWPKLLPMRAECWKDGAGSNQEGRVEKGNRQNDCGRIITSKIILPQLFCQIFVVHVALFIPCFVDLMFPQVGISMVQILERLGHTVDCPAELACCGQPAFNSG